MSSTRCRASRASVRSCCSVRSNYSLRIWLDPHRLTELNLTPNDVIAAVQARTCKAALGRIGAAPVSPDQQFQINIKTTGRLTRPDEFANIILRSNPDGSLVRISDVARVEMGAQSQDRYSRYNGAPAAALGIYQSPGSNAVDVAKQVRETMTTLATRFPNDLTYSVFFDTTVFVNATIDEVVRTLVIAIVLVAIVVFLFLGKLRTTLIPLIAVPVSIIGTFAVMLAIGYSANTVSLLALVLAIGIVVDDAIVVVENVERVIEEEPELSIPDACKKAMAEITGPILAITLVLLSVFVPVAFMPGISGQLFRQFAVAVSISMLISALNALTLCPALCSVLLKRGQRPGRSCAVCSAASTRRATAMWRSCAGWRGSPSSASLSSSACSRPRLCLRQDTAKLPARRGSGRDFRRLAASRRRFRPAHGRRGQAGRRYRSEHPRRRRRALGRRTQFHRLCRRLQSGLLCHSAQAL